MVEMIVFRDDEEHIKGFEMSGHANSGPYGHDLVCAAASAVSFGSINAIISICGIEPLIDMNDDGGYLKVMLPEKMAKESFEKAQTLLQGMLVSFQTIEKDYHQYITISEK
ncbi:ribosomal-processing cysteine protease Prp [Bacillaceae bacterium W0354]